MPEVYIVQLSCTIDAICLLLIIYALIYKINHNSNTYIISISSILYIIYYVFLVYIPNYIVNNNILKR